MMEKGSVTVSVKKINAIKKISFRSLSGILATLLIIFATSFTMIGFVVSKDVTLVINGKETKIATTRIYVEEVLAEHGIALNYGDRISVPLQSPIENGDTIIVRKGKRISLTVDGITNDIYSCEPTLKNALLENGIILNEHDEIEPSLETFVTDGMTVRIYRVEIYEEKVSTPIPRAELVKRRTDKPVNYSVVLSEGSDGSSTITYQVITRDGEEVSRRATSRVIDAQPVERIIEQGTGGSFSSASTSAPADLAGKRMIICTATAYTDNTTCNGPYVGKTATGRKPQYGVIAVDPKVIPLNSNLYVESTDGTWVYGNCVAGDTGGAIKGNKIDLFFNTYEECIQFGRRQAKVYILD